MNFQWIGLVVLVAVTNKVFSAITLTDSSLLPTFLDHNKYPISWIVYTFHFALVADLEEKSKTVNSNNETEWISYMRRGEITFGATLSVTTVVMDDTPEGTVKYTSKNSNDKGRGFELSELVTFGGYLLAFDDETGLIYIHDNGAYKAWLQVPAYEGATTGMEIEWAFVKDKKIYVGTNSKDSTWVAKIDKDKKIEFEDWKKIYDTLKTSHLQTTDGYILHEAVVWSERHNYYVFLPKSATLKDSNIANGVQNEKVLSTIMTLNDQFEYTEVIDTLIEPGIGFSSFKFVPGTGDEVIAAIFSKKKNDGNYETYFIIFDIKLNVIMEEVYVGPGKYEGFEFV